MNGGQDLTGKPWCRRPQLGELAIGSWVAVVSSPEVLGDVVQAARGGCFATFCTDGRSRPMEDGR